MLVPVQAWSMMTPVGIWSASLFSFFVFLEAYGCCASGGVCSSWWRLRVRRLV